MNWSLGSLERVNIAAVNGTGVLVDIDAGVAIGFLEFVFVLDDSTLSASTGTAHDCYGPVAHAVFLVAHVPVVLFLHLTLSLGQGTGSCGAHAAGFQHDALEALLEPVQTDENDERVDEDGRADAGDKHHGNLLVQVQLVDVNSAQGSARVARHCSVNVRVESTLRCGATCKEKRIDVVHVPGTIYDHRANEGHDDEVGVCFWSAVHPSKACRAAIQCSVMKLSFGLNTARNPGVWSLAQRPAVMMWPANMVATALPSSRQVGAVECVQASGSRCCAARGGAEAIRQPGQVRTQDPGEGKRLRRSALSAKNPPDRPE